MAIDKRPVKGYCGGHTSPPLRVVRAQACAPSGAQGLGLSLGFLSIFFRGRRKKGTRNGKRVDVDMFL